MARGSGLASEALHTGSFTHQPSGVSYRIDRKDGIARLHSTRESTQAPLDDTEQLAFYIGSGKHGQTYLFSRSTPDHQAKLWYEAPVNWYTRRAAYGMAPAFDNTASAPLALPTDANCLHCHATQIQQPLPTSVNAFADQPFLQAGIGCASCHGDATAHLNSGGKAPMLKLATLAPTKRDSVCLQCHLEGDAMIERPGKRLSEYQPGEDLSETAIYFVNASSPKSAQRASSQYEGLLRSACRRAAGNQLTCTTCHDPHSTPAPVERVAFYRGKCLQCHADSARFVAATHHPEQQDCATCHMPSRSTSDISHEQNVDHDIEAYPRSLTAREGVRKANSPQAAALELHSLGEAKTPPVRYLHAVDLVAVGEAPATDRERGLAYAQFAAKGDRDSYTRAHSLLRKVEFQGNADVRIHEQLGYLAQMRNDNATARTEYQAALMQSPHDVAVLSNLAVLQAQGADLPAAILSLSDVVTADPTQTAAALNLAMLQCQNGSAAAAKASLQRALRYNPDSVEARAFLKTGNYAGAHCAVH